MSDDFAIKDQSLRDFLAKPQLLYNSTWTTSDTDNLQLYNFSIANLIETTSYWANKVQGYNLYRGTAVITLIMNANPFQQGKLLMHFLPYTATSGTDFSLHNVLKSSKRMQPCVELDCRDSGAVLKIPYITPFNFYNRAMAIGDWGNVYLSVFARLKTGAAGETDVGYSLYMHFEDFELAAPILPQSNASRKKYSSKTVARGEHHVLSGGVISKGLGLAAVVADTVSVIPQLTPLAKPASWVFRGLECLASHFGWSKANIEQLVQPVLRSQNRCAAISDGVDSSIPLALINSNRTTVSACNSITDEDEMSIDFLKKVSTVIATKTWNTTDANGTTLLTQEIDPFQFKETSTKVVSTHTMTYAVGPPVYYLSNVMTSYRGSIKLTIKFAKTEFHSGRLQVVYTPVPTSYITTAPTITNSTLSLREIIDLRNGNEFTLHIPYLQGSNYQPSGTPMGVVYITVLNELRCPETVAQSVDYLIYASGGDDFEFQGLCNDGLSDFTGTFQNVVRVFSPQMDIKQVLDKPIGNSVVQTKGFEFAQQSFGESLASIKQLLQRMSAVYFISTSVGTSSSNVGFYPFTTGVLSLNASTGAIASPNIGGDMLSFLANMYRFYHGGMIVQYLGGNTGDVSAALYRINTSSTQLELIPQSFGSRGGNSWNNLTTKTMKCGIYTSDGAVATNPFEVPYYCHCKCSPVYNASAADSKATSATGVASSLQYPTHGIEISASSATTIASYSLMRSGRDDFQLSYFIGCPPVALSYV